ncbi:receptor-type tyrosine-protein phosphatase eta-like [Lycodopsis pacificus]
MSVYTNKTFAVLSDLIPGTSYTISVIAVAGDNQTEGHRHTFSTFTKPEVVRNIAVANITTSSISLMWTKPEGNSSFYRVQWTDGDVTDRPGEIGEPTVSTNTSSISLNWTPPLGEVFKYRLEWHNGGALMSVYTNKTFAVLSDLIPGTSYTISVIAVAGDNQTEGHRHTFSTFTKPEVVRNIAVANITTSSISLMWTKPEGNSSFYRVQWTDGNVTDSDNVTQAHKTITDLTAGVKYDITVTAVTDEGSTDGQSTTVHQYTKPAVVKSLTVGRITTSSISLMWTKPEGNSSFYRVQWTNRTTNWSVNVSETKLNVTELTAGVLYHFTVIAVAGDHKTERPGEIGEPTVSTNTSSISLNWTPPLGEVFKYRLEWHNGGALMSVYTNKTFAVLSDLIPGTSYTISVIAVAGDNQTEGHRHTFSTFTKPEVVRNIAVANITTSSISLMWTKPEGNSSFYRVQWTDGNVTDMPNPVLNLTASPKSTTSIKVIWSAPLDAKMYYKYLVQTYRTTAEPFNTTVSNNSTDVTELEPGTRYDINVTTIAAEGSESTVEQTFSYTMPKAVTNLTVEDVNTTSIRLTWGRQSDHKPSYSYLVKALQDATVVQDESTETETYTFYNLTPGKLYTFDVFTVVEGVKSTVESTQSHAKPEAVSGIMAIGSTTTMSVSWTPAVGQIDSYTALLYRDSHLENSADLSNATLNKEFPDLTPGMLYCVVVVTKSGPLKSRNSSVCNATFPNPPGPIMVESQTVKSIDFTWSSPEGMDHDQYNFSVSSFNGSFLIRNNWFLLNNLQSGSSSSISVVTVGVLNYESTAVTAENYTRPYAVTMLRQTGITTNAVTLEWEQHRNKSHYSYLLETTNGSITKSEVVLDKLDATITGLLSGSNYSFTVTTQTADGTQAAPVTVSYFTLPNPVLNLTASPKSTTSIKVIWSAPLDAKMYYKYLVQTYRTTAEPFNTTVSNNSTDVTELEPGTRYDINVTTIAAEGSESTVEQTFSYTMPKAVTNLTVEDVNTTSIRLTWGRQSDHKPSYSYLVKALQDATVVQDESTETETYTFYNLTPGKLYTFDVFTVVEGVKSTVESTQSHAKPEAVSGIMAIGSTTTMSVSWTPAVGQIDSYTALLYRDSHLENSADLSNATLNKEFPDLTPGMLYCVVVVTKSGPLKSRNSSVCNATFPNPPGPIMVESQTVKSIDFTWSSPEGMDHDQYNFSVSSFNGSFLIRNNWFLLNNLQSGSSSSISVVTVGVLNYESTAVTAENYTRPYAVTMLRQTGITTNAVTLEWEQHKNKSHYSYLLETTNGSITKSEVVLDKLDATITGLLSGSNYSFTVTTQTADGTQAAPVTVSYFTRPYSIGRLEPETLNTTAVRLVWTKPLEYKPEYTYRVKTTGCGSQNTSFAGEVAEISALIPGTDCTFCVFVRAADGIEGEAKCTSQYTEPEAVQPSISSWGSNSSIQVSWNEPLGKVEHYKVYLNSTSTASEGVMLDSTNTSFLFHDLSAGRVYTAVVTTFSGPFNASSGFITNATFPNPPGPIDVLTQTTSYIGIRWKEAPLMTGATFHYQLTKSSPQGDEHNTTTYNTSHTFTSLLSGTSYNFSVATVGAMGFKSEKVQINMVTTRPLSVEYLTASTEEKRITVMWVVPDDYKDGYRYNVAWESSNWTISDKIIVEENTYNIVNLVPGKQYYISVTTETSDGTKGAARWISNCTNASPVKDLECKSPNTTNAQVILSWNKPIGQHSGFKVTVNDGEIINSTRTCCSHTVSNLRHHTKYNLAVETQSCGPPSTPVSLDCWTGITNPPIPEDYESFVLVSSSTYNKFTLQIKSSLLNSINGPITHIGVLVTNALPGNTSDFTKYVGKTYKQWQEKDTPVYMATVVKNSFYSRSGVNHQDIVIGDESKWKGYTNGALMANGKYQYAIVLYTGLNLHNGLVNGEVSLMSTTNFYTAVTLPQDPAVIGIAVGATMGIFCILFIILIGFIIYWKRVSNKETSDIQIHSMSRSVAVRVEEYEAYYKKQRADSNCGFAEEFEDLKLVGTAQSKSNAERPENKSKNRYNNVHPYDSSRVKLSIIHGSPYDDYINASYMPGFNSRKEYIAAQGPLPTTVSEFWRMIWEKNVQTLVMLTRCNEQGRVKCEQYWDHGTKHFENITVTTTSEIELEDWTIRDFDIKNVKTAETRSVRHFHFTAWPDHGVPQTTELLISFRHLVREHMDQYSRHSPTVVHCSAGVGRTGTLIAIDRLIFQIERDNIVDLYGIVHDLRMHRPLMVQTEDQYVFLNQCAVDIIRSRTGTNVDLIYQNSAALSIYENIDPKTGFPKCGPYA